MARPKRQGWTKRKFTPGDMHPVPAGWRVGPPDYVGIGLGSAGTTWWHRLLLEHPGIVPNRLAAKELQYFYHFGYQGPGERDLETYRCAFAAPEHCVCGEWSPGYLHYPFAINYLKQAAPDTRILIMLRNPIDRFFSVLNRTCTRRVKALGLEGEAAYLFKTYSLFPAAISNCLCADAIERLFGEFERSNILVLQYERCKRSPEEEIARTYRFLQVDPGYRPKSISQVINPTRHLFRPLTAGERGRLACYYSEDVRRLARMLPEVDVSLWPDFQA